MLSSSFAQWVFSFNPIERVIVAATPVKRSESIQDFFKNRSTSWARSESS